MLTQGEGIHSPVTAPCVHGQVSVCSSGQVTMGRGIWGMGSLYMGRAYSEYWEIRGVWNFHTDD